MRDEQLRQTIQERAVELIGAFVHLKLQRKQYVGVCPFHADTHPSLSVSPEKGLFHCFGCGVGGDSLTFLMRRKGLTFPEALEEATRLLGLPPPARPHEVGTARLAHAAECATQLLAQWLWRPEGEPGRRYLQTRGIHAHTAKTFRLGYHPEHPTALLRALAARGVTAEEAAALGLATRKGNRWVSCFRGRLIFPIPDGRGQVCGFGARAVLNKGPKYLNSPDSPIFHKGHLLYGLAHARAALHTRGEAFLERFSFGWDQVSAVGKPAANIFRANCV
jgi:DNA primase